MTMATTRLIKQYFFAFCDISQAYCLSPLYHALSTLEEYTIAAIPVGTKQKTVASIDQAR